MKKSLNLLLVMVFLLSGVTLVFAGMHQQGSMGKQMQTSSQDEGWFCPLCGSHAYGGMHSGMMGMNGRSWMGMGPGMMQQGWSRGGCPRDKAGNLAPIEKDEAKMLMKNYVAANPNLKIGKITEKDDMYVGEVVTKDGSLVENLEVDKNSCMMRRSY
jgi:hypothetical protein